MNEFQQLMLNLDIALTGNEPPEGLIRQLHHYPPTFEKWMMEPGGNPVWYLSDSGYSRVVWSMEDKYLFLTYNSTSKVKARWEAAKPQRDAVEAYLRAEMARMHAEYEAGRQRPESKAERIVNTLLN